MINISKYHLNGTCADTAHTGRSILDQPSRRLRKILELSRSFFTLECLKVKFNVRMLKVDLFTFGLRYFFEERSFYFRIYFVYGIS